MSGVSVQHVYPVDDLAEHDTDGGDCVCGPTVEFVVGGWVFVHRSFDSRELEEAS